MANDTLACKVVRCKFLHPADQNMQDIIEHDWFGAKSFEDWFESIGLPYFIRKRKKVIIGDNLSSFLLYKLVTLTL